MGFAIATEFQSLPHAGQKVIVRNRPARVRSVVAHDRQNLPALHEVQVEYIDAWAYPESDTVIWELERYTKLHNRLMLPQVENQIPDPVSFIRAFLYANQWSAVNRLSAHSRDDKSELRLISPWQSAVQVEDYQLYPVLKALQMSRISLLLADDVGLGKTIETGLILSELFARRRIRRVLIICPASLQLQWRDEMREKFHLDFTIVDRDETFKLQRDLGIDSNPWASFPRIITSMDYLRQQDVLSSFKGATQGLANKADGLLPWQMLVVDEAHNLIPNRFGDDSDRCGMLRTIAPLFEHRLFLSATPHNGYTSSFTGLLELLDPVRFQQKTELDVQDEQQIKSVMVRRLKKELNQAGQPDRFAHRAVEKLVIQLYPQEQALFDVLREYRLAVREVLQTRSSGQQERNLGEFLIKLLIKRLLSSSYAFARTWWRHVDGQEGQEEQESPADLVEQVTSHAVARAEMALSDDQERDQREEDAIKQTGSWLRGYADALKVARERVSCCLEELGWRREIIEDIADNPEALAMTHFPPDARWNELLRWINTYLRSDQQFKDDERLIIFTEYKHTLDYLMARLLREGMSEDEVKSLYGGASSELRETIKTAFNDKKNPLRILVGTDTVSEGISLQNTCRYVLHQEIPWNPMRLEQRNGRVDRHGQERDVKVFHFSCNDEADLQFMERVVQKVEQAREDLGSVGQVIDQTVEEYFTRGIENATSVLDKRVEAVQEDAQDVRDLHTRDRGSISECRYAMERLYITERALELSPAHCVEVLERVVNHERGYIKEEEPGMAYRFSPPPVTWKKLIEESFARQQNNVSGLPKLVFDPQYFEEMHGGRRIFKPRVDATLIRLGHPLMQRALGNLRRKLWDDENFGRWTLEGCAELPYDNRDGILVLSVFLEVTNAFREVAHQEVITLPFSIYGYALEDMEADQWESYKRLPRFTFVDDLDAQITRVRDLWVLHQGAIEQRLTGLQKTQEQEFTQRMQTRYKEEYETEKKVFKWRLDELDKQRDPRQLERLQRAIEREQSKIRNNTQMKLLPEEEVERQQDLLLQKQHIRDLEQEKDKIIKHIEGMQQIVKSEQDRVLTQVLPNRYTLATVDVHPLTVEYIMRASRKELH